MKPKNPKDLLFPTHGNGVQVEIPQKVILEALLEGGEKLAKLCTILREAQGFVDAYLPEPVSKEEMEEEE